VIRIYHGGDLQDLFRDGTVEPPTRRLLHDVADRAGQFMTAAAKAHTPIASGRTRVSFEQLPVQRVRVLGETGYQSGVKSSYWKAVMLENNIKPHDVAPKRGRAISTPHGPAPAPTTQASKAHTPSARRWPKPKP